MICITSFHKDHWTVYAKKFLETWKHYWPSTARLIIYGQDCKDLVDPYLDGRIIYIDLDQNPKVKEFEKHAQEKISAATGKSKNKFLKARRWSYKVFSIADAINNHNERILWLDSDTATFSKIPDNWFDVLLEGKDLAVHVEPNEPKHGMLHWETGLFLIAGTQVQRQQIANNMLDIYESGNIFEREKTWDGLVWPEACTHMTLNDLNKDIPKNSSGKVIGTFLNKNVRPYMKHFAGGNKFKRSGVNERSGRID
jgi:hypothetical protein